MAAAHSTLKARLGRNPPPTTGTPKAANRAKASAQRRKTPSLDGAALASGEIRLSIMTMRQMPVLAQSQQPGKCFNGSIGVSGSLMGGGGWRADRGGRRRKRRPIDRIFIRREFA
jgi:hypothetical protein